MNTTLEESTIHRVTPLLEVIVSRIMLSECKVINEQDLLFVLIIVLLIENGLMPVDDSCEVIDPFNSIEIQQLTKWKLATGLYEAYFILGGCRSTTLKIVMSPLGTIAIINAIIIDLNSETYSVCLPMNRYIVSPNARSVPMIFGDLKHFVDTFKSNILFAVKSRILNYYGYPSASLLGLPDEVLYKIILFLSVNDVLNLCKTCNRFKYLLENNSLWHRLYVRDFDIQQCESKEWKQVYKERYLVQTELRKRAHRSVYSGNLHDYMDYSDYVSYIENPMWDEFT